MQIATWTAAVLAAIPSLCLHTLRADCNDNSITDKETLLLCLHTPRTDCNFRRQLQRKHRGPLPPHAPYRLQPLRTSKVAPAKDFASTRPVQIATALRVLQVLHELFASTRPVQIATTWLSDLAQQVTFASTRPVQIATDSAGTGTSAGTPLPPHAPYRLQRQKCTECNMHFSERVLSR
mgnify:CR=1 FL=1